MSTRKSLRQTLSQVLPAGALGASFLLGLASSANAMPSAAPPPETGSVADQLSAIRATVSELNEQSATGGSAEPETHAAQAEKTWWGNGGWGRWHLGWGNGGWGNGGWHNWHNGGWGNGGWNNWHNGWHNGWHNFWHNG
jgi:rSAM-associated Gly-rich repeat protein